MQWIKKNTPDSLKRAYHLVRAFAAAAKSGYPAKRMLIIGITGTKGKTSSGNYIWSVLQHGGYETGLISSAIFRKGLIEEINSYHMTMPSPFVIQRKLREMYDMGIRVAVVEMTSEGMKHFRHYGIPVDIAVFTNLTPEHLSSHKNDFEVYKRAKAPMFRALNHSQKTIFNKKVPRVIVANADSPYASFYLQFKADEKITYGIENGGICAVRIEEQSAGTTCMIEDHEIRLAIPGAFNIYNALPAYIVGKLLDIPKEKVTEGLAALKIIPGRMERIEEGQSFSVFVDYAHEPASLGALLAAAEKLKTAEGKIILLIGVIGGGRESRVPLAALGAQKAAMLIITNEDPYEADPEKLIEELATTAEKNGKVRGQNLFPIPDRQKAIATAFDLAREGDIVLISGKGAETTMMTKTGAIPWDERAIVRMLLKDRTQK